MTLRAASLSPRAPEALRRRCEALAPKRASSSSPAWVAWRSWGLAVATVALVVAAGAVFVGVAAHSPAVLAAELSLDHMKCFALFEPKGGHPADPAAVSRQLEADYGWRLVVPASLPAERLTLLGARRCVSSDGTLAHVLYRHGGRPLSLFMMPQTTRAAAHVAVGSAGRVVEIWSRASVTYALLGDESPEEMAPVTTYFQSVLAPGK